LLFFIEKVKSAIILCLALARFCMNFSILLEMPLVIMCSHNSVEKFGLKFKDVDLYSGVSLARPLLDCFTMWQTTDRNVGGVGRPAVTSGELASPDLPG
jgi:hypothetical protein